MLNEVNVNVLKEELFYENYLRAFIVSLNAMWKFWGILWAIFMHQLFAASPQTLLSNIKPLDPHRTPPWHKPHCTKPVYYDGLMHSSNLHCKSRFYMHRNWIDKWNLMQGTSAVCCFQSEIWMFSGERPLMPKLRCLVTTKMMIYNTEKIVWTSPAPISQTEPTIAGGIIKIGSKIPQMQSSVALAEDAIVLRSTHFSQPMGVASRLDVSKCYKTNKC